MGRYAVGRRTVPRRRGLSDNRFAGVLAVVGLAVIVSGMGITSILSSGQMATIQSQQAQIEQLSAGQAATQGGSTVAASGNSAPVTPTTRHITLVAEDATIQIANNVTYDAWTFNGTVPGPTITVNQGDKVVFKLINNVTAMAHSIDFHAAQVDWSTDYAPVGPGQTKMFNFTVDYPGIFIYHCGTPPVLEHIGNGMYGTIIVNPSSPLPAAPGGTYVIVQSEFYLNAKAGADGNYAGNYTRMLAATPTYVVFNGVANQYVAKPLPVQPNQLVRLFVLNVGPDHWSAFHVIGALMDTVYIDGNPVNVEHGLQTLNIPPSGGAIVDMYFRDPGGKNPFVTHDFADASIGATGLFAVQNGTAGPATSSSTTTASGASVHVAIPSGSGTNTSSTGYSPASITVVIGVNNTVVWTNKDSVPHTVTAVDKSFDSGNMNAGDAFTYTFTTAGTYQYTCSYHPWMKGTVVVKAP
jgi:copper-containing nitrite reductase